MKAIVMNEFGGPEVLHLGEIAKPTPTDSQVLIRVRATSVNIGDLMARNFKQVTPSSFNMIFPFWLIAKVSFGLQKPNIHVLGSEFSGVVEGIGKEVKRFKVGDEVFGYLGPTMGAYAEYICLPENGTLAIKPANLTHPEAAVISYGAIMALHLLRAMNIQPGQKVLINGASGGIGSAAVQVAKYYGAEVTGVCGTPRLEFVKSLGADHVIDYTREDFTRNGETYDLIVDILGRCNYTHCKGSLKVDGRILYASFKMKHLFEMMTTGRKKIVCAIAPGNREDLESVKALIEDGKLKTVIDRNFPMAQAAEAHHYVENGMKKGNVAIVMG